MAKRTTKKDNIQEVEYIDDSSYTVRKKKDSYKMGTFSSKKNNRDFIFRSAYEFALINTLEKDDNVVQYLVEPFKVPYTVGRTVKSYLPDFLVLHKDGSIKVLEVKPLSRMNNLIVQKKAAACREFLKRHMPTATYHFITEDDIFSSQQEYKNLLKILNK